MNLRGLNFSNVVFINHSFAYSDLQNSKFLYANLREANFSNANLKGTNFKGAFLTLYDTSLSPTGANFSNANLQGAEFSGPSLNFVNFKGANLRGATFDNTVLNANFEFADLRSADLLRASDLVQSQLNQACGNTLTKLKPPLTIKPCPE